MKSESDAYPIDPVNSRRGSPGASSGTWVLCPGPVDVLPSTTEVARCTPIVKSLLFPLLRSWMEAIGSLFPLAVEIINGHQRHACAYKRKGEPPPQEVFNSIA